MVSSGVKTFHTKQVFSLGLQATLTLICVLNKELHKVPDHVIIIVKTVHTQGLKGNTVAQIKARMN